MTRAAGGGVTTLSKNIIPGDGYLELPDLGIIAITRGYDGSATSKKCAERAIELLKGLLPGLSAAPDDAAAARKHLNAEIAELARLLDSLRTKEQAGGEWSCSLELTWVRGDRSHHCHVGGGTQYRVRQETVKKLFLEHARFAELLAKGESVSEIRKQQGYRALGEKLGQSYRVAHECLTLEYSPGDQIIMVADGFSALEAIEEHSLGKVLKNGPSAFGTTAVAIGSKRSQSEPPRFSEKHKEEVLSEVNLFSQLIPMDISRILAASTQKTFTPGAPLVTKGEPSNALLVILEGEIEIIHGADKKHKFEKSGWCIGETVLFEGARRSSTVIAKTGVTAIELTRASLFDLMESERQGLGYRLMGAIARGLARRLGDEGNDGQ